MAYSKNLRIRNSVDFKKLNCGEELPRSILAKRTVRVPAVLPETYSVERLIDRKETSEGTVYLVKWANYHKQESTWEPASHLSPELTCTFLIPEVSTTRLQLAAESFESAIQQRLSSRQNRVIVTFDLDIFRHVFNSNKSVLINVPSDLSKLPVCDNWHYRLNKHGKGIRLSFPVRITPRLYNKYVFARKNGELVRYSLPVEKVVIICATEPFV